MGVQIKQATYAGPDGFGIKGDPPVPDSGKPQPLVDTSARRPQPGVKTPQANATAGRHLPNSSPSVPDCGSQPEGSTDYQDQTYTHIGDWIKKNAPDIFKGSKSNG